MAITRAVLEALGETLDVGVRASTYVANCFARDEQIEVETSGIEGFARYLEEIGQAYLTFAEALHRYAAERRARAAKAPS